MFPAEVLIVHMNERAEEVYGDHPFAIRGVSLAMGETFNLSRARNMAMERASSRMRRISMASGAPGRWEAGLRSLKIGD